MVEMISFDSPLGYSEPSFDHVKNLIEADTKEKLAAFAKKHGNPFAYEYGDKDNGENAFADLRAVLMFAIELKAMIDNGNVLEADFLHAGVEVSRSTWEGCLPEPLLLANWHMVLKSDAYTEYLKKSLSDSNTPIPDGDPILCERLYGERLKAYCECYEWNIPNEVEECNVLAFYDFANPELGEGPTERMALAEAMLDLLCTVHLYGLRIEVRKGVEIRRSVDLASSLWYALVSSFSDGRAGICGTCGKPFVAFGERGRKRKYCSEACNKKHQRMRMFEQLLSEGLDELEAAKTARISLETAKKLMCI